MGHFQNISPKIFKGQGVFWEALNHMNQPASCEDVQMYFWK